MARRAKEDDVAVMTESATRLLLAGEEVEVADIAADRDRDRATHLRAAVEGQRSPELAGTLASEHARTVGAWEALLRRSLASGVVATDLEPRALAALVVTLPLGLSAVLPGLDDATRVAIADAWTAMLRAVLHPDPSAGAGRAV